MSDQSAPEQVVVPVKVAQPEQGGPPTLAEPASGPVAEVSGALPQDALKPEQPAKPVESSSGNTTANGESTSAAAPVEKSTEETPITGEPESVQQEKSTPAAPATDQDAEMKDAEADTGVLPETNGASISKPKRKSSAGVPEHKTKTLKKKQSKAKLTNLDAQPGDLFLARLRSYPPWPSIICDEAMLPSSMLKTRPVTAMQSDGKFKEAYADGGVKAGERTYPIMFLYTNEFAWIPNTDLSPVTPEECRNVTEKGKAKNLLEGYKVAGEEHDLNHFKEMLLAHEEAMQAEESAKQEAAAEKEAQKAEKAAAKASKTDKKKSKPEAKADEDVDMADVADEPKKGSKKRKKDVESDDEESEKPAKTPKTTKLKLTTGKTPTTEKKTEKKTPKPKAEKKKKAAESEEEEVEAGKETAPPLDPVQERKDREKEVLFLRHKLQKGFLSRDQEPAEAEMPQMATYLKKLEAYGDKLEVSIIRTTKINKVLKGIVKLNTIPKDEEFHFRERSVALLGIWNQLLGAEPSAAEPITAEANESDKPDKDKPSPATTNGVHKEAEEKAEEKIEPEVSEPKESTSSTEEAVNKISAEVPAGADEKEADIDEIQKEEKPEETKPDSVIAPTIEKAPESAQAAAEVTEVVKAAE